MSFARLVVASFLLAGCGEVTSVDGGAPRDGGGGADAGAADGGAATDAGPTDAGEPGDASVDCASAVVDTPCSVEGAFCGGPCTDECSFCNLLSCSGGTWNRVEVFPAPCFDCGESLRCVANEQHCVHTFSDVGGVPDDYECADNPPECMGDMATCACLDAALIYDECVEPNPGELEIRYFGG